MALRRVPSVRRAAADRPRRTSSFISGPNTGRPASRLFGRRQDLRRYELTQQDPGKYHLPTVEIVAGLPGYVPPVVAEIVPEKQTNPEEQIIQIPEDSLSGAVEGIAESATQSQLASSEGSLVSSISVAAAYRCGAAAVEMISEFAVSSETEIAASSASVPPGQGNPVQSQDFAGAGTCVYRAFPETAEIL